MGSIRVARDGSFVAFLVMLVLFVVGFACPFWVEELAYHNGLWEACLSDRCDYITNTSGMFLSVQIQMSVSLALQVAAFGCFIGWYCMRNLENFSSITSAALSLCIASGCSTLSAIILFAVDLNAPGALGWSWILCTIAGPGTLLTGAITLGIVQHS